MKEQTTLIEETSSYHLKDLNETQLSHITKESGEKDFKE